MAMSIPTTVLAESVVDEEAVIEELYDRRDKLNVSAILNQELGLDNTELVAEIDEIDVQLAQLGVEDLTSDEVMERFGNDEEIMPYVTKPSSNNVNWKLDTSHMVVNGVTYEIQTLTATAKTDYSSNLRETKEIVMQCNKNTTAGALNVLKVAANSLVNLVVSSNAGAKLAKTAYDYAKAFISGLSSTTTISDVKASYMIASSTTAKFKYVRKQSDPENSQKMTYASTKCEVAVQGSFPVFTYSNGQTHPNIVNFNDRITATPNNFESDYNAVNRFINPEATPAFAYVNGVDIYGLEGKKITRVSTICPSYPAQVG